MYIQIFFIVGVIVTISGLCFFLIKHRDSRYKKIAEELKADYISQGFFKTGKISGIANGKKFTIENIKTSSGRSSTFWTHISIDCQNKGIPLFIRNDFFKNFPNWKAAFTVGERKERVFFTHITIKNAFVPLEEKYYFRVLSIFQGIKFIYNKHIRKGNFNISKTVITYKVHGIMKNLDKIKRVLDALNRVIQNIENNPIAD